MATTLASNGAPSATASPDLPRGLTRFDLIPALATLVALIMATVIHSFFIWPAPVQVGFDEGYEAAVVERIIDGSFLPYVDGLSHRGPFLYWTQAIFHLIFGRFEWTGTRFLALGAALTTGSCTFLAAWAAGWPVAGALAALLNVFITCAVIGTGGGIGVHGEPVAVAYLALGFFLVSYALNRARSPRLRMGLLIAGGVFTAVCGLTKQTLAVASIPLFFWVLVHPSAMPAATPPATRWFRRWLRHGAVQFAGGGIALVLLVLLRYAIAGELGTFYFWSLGFNAKVYLGPFEGLLEQLGRWFWRSAWAMCGTALALLLLARPLSFVDGRSFRGLLAGMRGASFEFVVASMALTLLAAAALPLRFWDHYFLPIYPFFGLIFGVFAESATRRGARVPRPAQAAVLLVGCVMAVTHPLQMLKHLHTQRKAGSWLSHRPDPACAEIDRLAGAGHTPIFIWGTIGDLYITCRRPSASMFTYTTVLAGIIPPSWRPDPNRVTPGTRETLLRELNEARPPVIIDYPISRGGGMTDIPMFAQYLRTSYCSVPNVKDKRERDLMFYVRKDLDACKVTPASEGNRR